jgi:hypothetical protein
MSLIYNSSVTCDYAGHVMKALQREFKPELAWNKPSLENCFKEWSQDKSVQQNCFEEWSQDKSVQQFVGLPSILVSSLWWARNSSLFRYEEIPPNINANIIINLARRYEIEISSKKTSGSNYPGSGL